VSRLLGWAKVKAADSRATRPSLQPALRLPQDLELDVRGGLLAGPLAEEPLSGRLAERGGATGRSGY
jgi:hypothetical protein